MAASLNPDIKAPQASIRAVMKKFDFGVLVRRANPKADMGGLINLDVDLKSSAGSFEKLMANANGYFDFSGRLENLKAGIIDLWAVNLIAAVVSKDDENQSKINCVVGRWTMKDGLLKPDIFLIDTSKRLVVRLSNNPSSKVAVTVDSNSSLQVRLRADRRYEIELRDIRNLAVRKGRL